MLLKSGFKTLLHQSVVRKNYSKPLNTPRPLPTLLEMEEPVPAQQVAQELIIINGAGNEAQVPPANNQSHAHYRLPLPHKFTGSENLHHWIKSPSVIFLIFLFHIIHIITITIMTGRHDIYKLTTTYRTNITSTT